MKKILCFVIICIVIFSGCGKTSDYREPEKRLYVSSLGFDRLGEEIRVCAEVISISDNASGDGYSIKYYDGGGDSIASAMYEITKDIAPSVNLSHCAILVLGEGMKGEYFKELLEFGQGNQEITYSIQLVATDDAKKLLQYNKESTKPLGFQISELLTEDIDGIGADKSSTLASVINKRETENEIFTLPYFEVEDENYLFSGTRLYKRDGIISVLDRSETQLLSIARNEFAGGEIKLAAESGDVVAELKKVRTTAKWEAGDPQKLVLLIDIKSSAKENAEKFLGEILQVEMREVIVSLRDEEGINPLEIDKLTKQDYEGKATEKFLNSEILVECKVKGDK